MSVIIDQYIFRLELPVNDACLMQKLNSDDDLGEHVSDSTFGKDEVLLSGVEIEIALGQVLHHDVNVFLILEDLSDVREEGVLADRRNQLCLQQVELVVQMFQPLRTSRAQPRNGATELVVGVASQLH